MTDLVLSPSAVLVLGLAAALVGFAKTGVPGVGPLAVAVFAVVLPARESTGALLPLLIVGDLVALAAYRRHASRPALLRLFPSVAAGVLVGVVFVDAVDDVVMRRTIGAVLLLLVAVHLLARRRTDDDGAPVGRGRAAFFGGTAGFTTMVANAGGPVMSLYLLSVRLDKLTFLGTAAWFFFLVNVFKLPFSIGLGLIDAGSLLLDAALVPALLAGAWVGRRVIRRIPQETFEKVVLVLTVVAALNLVR